MLIARVLNLSVVRFRLFSFVFALFSAIFVVFPLNFAKCNFTSMFKFVLLCLRIINVGKTLF